VATSGTVGQTVINVSTMLEHAFRRAGLSPTEATTDSINSAKQNLYFYLSALSNDGVNLWTIEKKVFGMNIGQANYQIGVGAVDLKNVLRRTTTWPSGGTASSSAGGTAANAFDKDLSTACTQTSAGGSISYQFASSTRITTVGIMTNGDQTYTLSWEYSEDGSTWTSVLDCEKTNYSSGEWNFYDIEAPKSAEYFRVRETGLGILNVVELVFGVVVQEIPLGRINIDNYTNLTDKTMQASVVQQYWYNRKVDNPEIVLWPVPSTFLDQLVVWKNRNIQDVGELTNTLELPQRWVEAGITELAARMILELPDVDVSRYNILKQEAAAATNRAQQEERDRSPIMISPNISCYTR